LAFKSFGLFALIPTFWQPLVRSDFIKMVKEEVAKDPVDGGDENEGEEDAEAVEEVVVGDTITYSMKLLPLIRNLQAQHGLRHGDYQRYRGYCSRRLARLRKVLNFVQGDRRKFVKKEMNVEAMRKAAVVPVAPEGEGKKPDKAVIGLHNAALQAKHLQLPLMQAERAWAYAMQLKFEMNSERRKKFHMINRLKKAKGYSGQLAELVMAGAPVDAVTKLEAQAYHAWMSGTLAFESSDWEAAVTALTSARDIYDRLASTFSVEEGAVYRARMDEIVPSLRYCAYNIGGDSSNKESVRSDLLNLRGSAGAAGELDDLIRETREQQSATLQEVEWRGRKMAVKQKKARNFLLREQEFATELEQASSSTDEKIAVLESFLMDCKDAIQALREDLVEDPAYRNRQQTNQGPVSSMHFLHTYLTFIKCNKVIDRNLVMINGMKQVLSGAVVVEKGKKPVKPQDLVRLFENIIQNLNDMKNLAGLDEDLEFHHEIEAKVSFYKAARCFYIALTFLNAEKWPEAMALFQRARDYGNKAKKDSKLADSMRKEVEQLDSDIESRQFMAHANSILEQETIKSKEGAAADDIAAEDLDQLPLVQRLDRYFEDKNLTNKKPNLAEFPPPFQPIPCKPFYFNLAREHLEFPDLESKINQGQKQGQQKQGWLGGWLGWGGKK